MFDASLGRLESGVAGIALEDEIEVPEPQAREQSAADDAPYRHGDEKPEKKKKKKVVFEKEPQPSKSSKCKDKEVEIPEKEQEVWGDKRNARPPDKRQVQTVLHSIHRIPWGGSITADGKEFRLTSTCSIANQLQIFYTVFKTNLNVQNYVKEMGILSDSVALHLIKVFRALDAGHFVLAKTEWIVRVMKITIEKDKSVQNVYGSEEDFLIHIKEFTAVKQIQVCRNPNCPIPAVVIMI
jgi:hypothetical protein